MKILCGIVTCDRTELLKRCIKNINNQNLPPDMILIVNHGKILVNINSNIKLNIINQNNNGSAAGWNRAIDYAIKNDFDFIWLMDDDGYPEKDSLSLLTKNFTKNLSCISSLVINENHKNELVFSMPKINKKNIFDYIFKIKKVSEISRLSNNCLYPFVHLFNGALISVNVLKKIGNININYRIYGEEVDYFYRLKQYGPLYTLITSRHYHPSVSKKMISEKNIYYLLRNSIINNNKYSKFKLLKNLIIIFVTLVRVFRRNGLIFLIKFLFNNKFIFFKSIYDGHKKL
tara:strand:- start:472 stop:1335 length:864 start_codon:yes stop_codon:yes gene_type:complete